ncbi:MAG: hypothetical protein EOO77_24465 [Oxalobacteraceae bacterium]|nr:MAG: hypothetical protein EOO77_24465 [Oxalobacteraceae bacterium]
MEPEDLESQYNYSVQQALQIIGDIDEEEFGDAVAKTAKVIRYLREDQPEASEGLKFEEGRGALKRRAKLLRAIAGHQATALELRKHLGLLTVPAILSVFRALGFADAYYIVEGITALQRGVVREEGIAPSSALIQALIVQVGQVWLEITGEFPDAPFAPDAPHCSPYGGFGAEYVYRVLIAAGWDCSREEVGDNLEEALGLLVEIDEYNALYDD